MIGEYRDFAIAFAKGVIEGQNAGINNRKLIEPRVLCELLALSSLSKSVPRNVLAVFKEYNVYVRKLRGKDLWGVWWLEEGDSAHGRGTPKR